MARPSPWPVATVHQTPDLTPVTLAPSDAATDRAGIVRFGRNYATATFEGGRTVEFTALESQALDFLSRNAGRTLPRGAFLDALGDADGRRGERSIDFLINRLRRKLDDDSRTPRYIATRYGEGYVWLAGSEAAPDLEDAFCVVYLRGAPGQAEAEGTRFGRAIQRALQEQSGDGRRCVWAGTLDAAPTFVPAPELLVEVACFRDGDRTELMVSARSGATGMIVQASRHPQPEDQRALKTVAEGIAGEVLLRDWSDRTFRAETEVPMAMVAYAPAGMPYRGPEVWPAVDPQLRRMREDSPDDPRIKLLYATHLHSKYVLLGHELLLKDAATWDEDEAEIERLVLDSLEYAQDRPDYAIAAAKLLFFVGHSYRDIAEDMAERALRAHDRPATSMSMVAQLRTFLGRVEAARELHAQAVALSPRDTEYRIYTLFLQAQAHLAAGDSEGLVATEAEIYGMLPTAVSILSPLLTDPEAPSKRARAAALATPLPVAKSLLANHYYLCGRLFIDPAQGYRVMRAPATLYQERHGPDVLPAPVRRDFPDLLL